MKEGEKKTKEVENEFRGTLTNYDKLRLKPQ